VSKILQGKVKGFLLSAVLVSGSFVLAPVQEAQASQARKPATYSKVTSAGNGSARFDWLAGKRRAAAAPKIVPVSARGHGNGAWICSPAGFGQHAKCFRR